MKQYERFIPYALIVFGVTIIGLSKSWRDGMWNFGLALVLAVWFYSMYGKNKD